MPTERNDDVLRFPEEVRRYYRVRGDGTRQALGMGCATIGRAADASALLEFQKTLDFAYESGLRYFDTSAQYGGSEFRVGEFLRRVPREEVFIATKSPLPASLTPSEAGLFFRQAVRNSRERLNVATIDLFQVHDVHTLDAVLAPGGGMDALKEARAAGEIRHIGLGVRFHDLLARAAFSGDFDTILTYADYTPLNVSAARLIADAAARGVGVINGSPLSQGLLTGDDPRQTIPHDGEPRQRFGAAVRFYDLCQANGWSTLAAAIQFPLRNPNIHITLTGPGSVAELRGTLNAADSPLPAEAWETIRAEMNLSLA